MSDLRTLLERTKAQAPTPELRLDDIHRRQGRRSRNRRLAAGVFGIALAAIAVIVAADATHFGPRPAVQPSPSPSPPIAVEGTYRLLNVSDGSVTPFPAPEGGSWFRFSPDGSDVIFVKDDARGRPQLFRMGADGSDLAQITPVPEWASEADEPAWSADGKWIAYSGGPSGQRELIAARPDGYHPPRAAVGWGVRDARAPSWSPDGSKIAVAARGGIWIQPLEYYNGNESITSSRRARLLLSSGSSPAWSPGGDQIAFTSGQGSGRKVAIANADGTHVRAITDPTSDHPTWSPDGATIAYDVWSPDGHVAVWLLDVGTGQQRLLLNDASVESWKDDGTLLVST